MLRRILPFFNEIADTLSLPYIMCLSSECQMANFVAIIKLSRQTGFTPNIWLGFLNITLDLHCWAQNRVALGSEMINCLLDSVTAYRFCTLYFAPDSSKTFISSTFSIYFCFPVFPGFWLASVGRKCNLDFWFDNLSQTVNQQTLSLNSIGTFLPQKFLIQW